MRAALANAGALFREKWKKKEEVQLEISDVSVSPTLSRPGNMIKRKLTSKQRTEAHSRAQTSVDDLVKLIIDSEQSEMTTPSLVHLQEKGRYIFGKNFQIIPPK